tara:strand:+ start:2066 stop:2401 length:336 start_codon:yes stop_codon:yes gene_type:complete
MIFRLPQDAMSVYIEAPVVGVGGVLGTVKQAFVSGAVQAALGIHKAEIHFVHNGTWKKHVVGHGHASKDAIMTHVRRKHRKVFKKVVREDQDLADAFCLAQYGLRDHAGLL